MEFQKSQKKLNLNSLITDHKGYVLSLLMLVIFSGGRITYSVAQQNNFQKIATQDGLPSSCVYRSFEDSKGYMWYLTDKGISRYDGVAWKYFSQEDGFDELGAFHIAEAPNGRIWFITLNFKLYYYEFQRFHKIQTNDPVAWFDINKENTLHVISRLGNVFQMDSSLRMIPEGRPIKSGNAILSLGKGKTLIADHIGVFIKERNKTRLVFDIHAYRHGITPRMFLRSNGHVLLPNASGLYDFDPTTEQLTFLFSLQNEEVFCFFEDSMSNDAWLGTFNGLYRFNEGKINSTNVQRYLTDNVIFSIFKASNGNYYVSTKNQGVFVANFYTQHIGLEKELKDETILFIRKLDGIMYLFGANGTILYMKEMDGRYTFIPIHRKGKNIKNVSVFGDSALVTTASEIYVLKDKRLYPFKRYYSYSSEYPPVINLKSLSKTTLPVVGLLNNKVSINKIFPRLLSERLALHNDPGQYHSLVGAIENKAYFQLDTGLTEIAYNGSFAGYRIYPIHFVSDMDITRSGTLVLATLNKGIILMKGNKIRHIGIKEGLASDFCNRVYVNRQEVWVCTNKGLSRISLNSVDQPLNMVNFTSDNYLSDNEVNDIFIDGKRIFVATGKGISYFQTTTIIPKHHSQLVIEKVMINNIDITNRKGLKFSYDQNNLSVFFVSPNAASSVPILYRYVMIGDRIDSGYSASNHISYGNLSPGKYSLTIQARNGEGIWSDPYTLRLQISSPFWKTPWFIALCVVVVLLIGGIFVRMKLMSIRKEHVNRYMLVQSELRALRLYMNPHFIFNALNSAYHYIIQNESEKGGAFILGFSKVIRLTMNYSSRNMISLAEEIDLLHQYIALERERLRDKFSYQIEVEGSLNIEDTKIPPLIIQPFVENAIKYGISGLERQGNIHISFSVNGKFIQCCVDDDGIGRKAAGEKQSEYLRQGTSTGIKYIEERLKLLIHEKDIEPVKITDKYNGLIAEGTLIRLLIPQV